MKTIKEHLFAPNTDTPEKVGEREVEVPEQEPTTEEKLEALLDRLENANSMAEVRQAAQDARGG